jgi:ATP phosphoribosyltransferase
MKKKLKNMNHLIDQLKEDIQNKENAIVQAAINAKKLEKDKDILKAERDKSRQQVLESKDVINNQAAEEKKLLKIISEADAERVRQKKELEQVSIIEIPRFLLQNGSLFEI